MNNSVANYHWLFFIGLCVLLVSLSLSVDFPGVMTGFVGDMAVYLCMGQSFAYDFDCTYTRQDMIRIFEEWGTCPSGVFLKKVGSDLYYAKPVIYPLFAAPFVRVFETNGFLLFNFLLLIGMILMGHAYLRSYNSAPVSLLFSTTFFVFQVGYVYAFTIVPEVFNMFLITAGYFLWFLPRGNSEQFQSDRAAAAYDKLRRGRLRYLLAAVFLGMAAFSKLTNVIAFAGPCLAFLFDTTESRQDETPPFRTRFIFLIGTVLVFMMTILLFFGLQYYFTAEINPQGGDRKVFHYDDCPFSRPDKTFEQGGQAISPETAMTVKPETSFVGKILHFIVQRAELLPPGMFAADLYYFFFGRFGGLLPFFPVTMVALYVIIRERKRRQFLLLLTVGLTALLFLVTMPQNYVGGAALGNRYFINSYPIVLFLFTRISRHLLWFPWLVGGLFLSPLMLNPFQSNYNIGSFATRLPYTLLPLEQSLHANFPTNVNPKMNFIPFSMDPAIQHVPGSGIPHYNITFVDYNTYGYEWSMGREGFWVRGQAKTEFIIRFPGPHLRLKFTLQNGAVANKITLKAGWGFKNISSYHPGQQRDFIYEPTHPFPYFGHSLVKCSVECSNGFIPRFYEDISSDDVRFLGCYISIGAEYCSAGKTRKKN